MQKKSVKSTTEKKPKQTSRLSINGVKSEVRSILKRIIKEEVIKALSKKKIKESRLSEERERYSICYYATVGEHGEAGYKPDFKSALREALKFQKEKDAENVSLMDGLEYLGVEPSGGGLQFAVVFAEESYIKRIDSDQNFKSAEDRKAFVDAARKCSQTGKPVIGTFTATQEESIVKEAPHHQATKKYKESDITKAVKQYLETALWSSTDEDDEPMDAKYSINDFSDEAKKEAASTVHFFLKKLNDFIPEDVDITSIAHDLWLSQNGHGSGFFDADYLDDEHQKIFQHQSESFKEVNPVVGDDGKIYFE